MDPHDAKARQTVVTVASAFPLTPRSPLRSAAPKNNMLKNSFLVHPLAVMHSPHLDSAIYTPSLYCGIGEAVAGATPEYVVAGWPYVVAGYRAP